MFGGAKDFCPRFLKLARKIVVRLLPKHFLPQRLFKTFFWCDLQKKVLNLFFCKCWAQLFEVKICWAPIFPGFPRIFPGFLINQTFW